LCWGIFYLRDDEGTQQIYLDTRYSKTCGQKHRISYVLNIFFADGLYTIYFKKIVFIQSIGYAKAQLLPRFSRSAAPTRGDKQKGGVGV
jgi:hypothetical protein